MGQDGRRKAQLSFDSFVRMAEENKYSIISASLALYVGIYLMLAVSGVSFQAQPAQGYVTDTGSKSAGCSTGSVWVEGNTLRWCGNSNEYYFEYDGHADESRTADVAGPKGAMWIEGSDLCYIDQDSDKICVTAHDTGNNPAGSSGSVWMEGDDIHYIDQSGNEREVCEKSDGTDTTLCEN